MSTKHTLYQSLRSPFARRIRVLLEELGEPYETQVLDVFSPPQAFYEVNPLGRVPALKLAGSAEVLLDSQQIVTYFQNKHGTHALFQRGGKSFAQVSRVSALAVGLMESVIPIYLESRRAPGMQNAEVSEDYSADIHRALSRLESEFSGPYFFGEKLTQWDIDLGVAIGYCDLRLGSSACDRYPRLRRYFKTLNARPSFQKTVPPA